MHCPKPFPTNDPELTSKEKKRPVHTFKSPPKNIHYNIMKITRKKDYFFSVFTAIIFYYEKKNKDSFLLLKYALTYNCTSLKSRFSTFIVQYILLTWILFLIHLDGIIARLLIPFRLMWEMALLSNIFLFIQISVAFFNLPKLFNKYLSVSLKVWRWYWWLTHYFWLGVKLIQSIQAAFQI